MGIDYFKVDYMMHYLETTLNMFLMYVVEMTGEQVKIVTKAKENSRATK